MKILLVGVTVVLVGLLPSTPWFVALAAAILSICHSCFGCAAFSRAALGRAGFPWNANAGVEYNYSKGICPVVERMYDYELIYTPLMREPLTESDIDDFVAAIKKVLANPGELAG